MIRLAMSLAAALFLGLLCGCDDTSTGDSQDPFAVKFAVASVPRGLPLDSIEITITVGDTGKPHLLSVDAVHGVSQGTVQAFPGQAYTLSFRFFSGGYEIGAGDAKGTFSKDMVVALNPDWNASKVDQAYAAVHSGKYLPTYLDSAYGLAMAGRPLNLRLDSAADKSYRWWIRLGDSVIAEGSGTLVDWTPADSLVGRALSVKIEVLSGTTVVDERKWDLRVLAARRADRLLGIAIRNDTASDQGSLTWFRYTASGERDSSLDFDTTVFIAGRKPVSTVAYGYLTVSGRSYPKSASRAFPGGEAGVDTAFAYDADGRLTAVSVALKSGTTVDSLFYGANGSVETRSYAQGTLTRVVRHSSTSAHQTIDSAFSFSPPDTGRVLTRLVLSIWQDTLLLSTRTWVSRGGLTPSASDRYVYNGLGALAFRFVYTEGQAPELSKSEAYQYDSLGRLAKAVFRDETTGDIERVEAYVYGTGPAAAKIAVAPSAVPQFENRLWLRRLTAFANWSQPAGSRPTVMPRLDRAP